MQRQRLPPLILAILAIYTELRLSKDWKKNSDLSLRNQICGILMAGLPAILITHILFGATKDLCYIVLLKIILIDQQYFFLYIWNVFHSHLFCQ